MLINVEDYGLVGNGVFDNYPAIQALLARVITSEEPDTLIFQKNAVYYFLIPEDCEAAFLIDGAKHLTIEGNNTTFLLDGGFCFFNISNCEDIAVSGFNFKLAKPIYTISEILQVDFEKLSLVVRSHESLGITKTWTSPNPANFATPNLLDYGRKHIFFHTVKVLNASENLYELKVTEIDNYMEKLKWLDVVACSLITPIPNVGQVDSAAFLVKYTRDFRLENCNVWSASYFAFHMRYNEGSFIIRNVNIQPEPASHGLMVAWRDGFHIKDNRAKFIWENCSLGYLLDDIWNLSCSILTVRKIYGSTDFEMGCMEFGGEYPVKLLPGDELYLYNVNTGEFVGSTHIDNVIWQNKTGNRVTVTEPIENLVCDEVQVCVYSLANPGSEIRSCYADGTFRIRSETTVSDSKLRLFYSWIENEPPYEGPVPRNITFRNCQIKGLNDECMIMTLGTLVSLRKPVKPDFHAKNIMFENCNMNPKRIYIRTDDDEVRFINCKPK